MTNKRDKMRFFLRIVWVISCLSCLSVVAQTKYTLSGRVLDEGKAPLPMATIAVENTTLGTYSDEQGQYHLKLNEGTYTLVVSTVGYESVKMKVTLHGNKRQDFRLKESSVSLNVVEVLGKSKSQQIREGAFAVNALDVKPLINSVGNLNEMVNRTTGIRVREEGGVGSDFDLSINGMSGNSVRYFIDGVPLSTKGTGVSLANLPVNLIERIEIYKGVVPASLGDDALGGAINIITNQSKRNYLDVSYGIGSFHTHRADLNAQFVEPKSGLIVKPTLGVNYSKNDYLMKGVEVRNADKTGFITTDCRRFHDDYLSLLGQLEVGVTDKPWADAFFVSGSYSLVNKELQTGSVQTWVYGMAERNSHAASISARYQKQNLFVERLSLQALLSQTWDHSETIDTTYRKYYWDGSYINGSFSEIRGRGRSWRHYDRPLTMSRVNLSYALNEQHTFSLNYLLNRTGNKQSDEVDETYVPTNDALVKHVIGLSYTQSFLSDRLNNVFFLKDYVNHLKVEQTELSSITGSATVKPSDTHLYWGGGLGSRFTWKPWSSWKLSYEHSVRLPLSQELLGNGATIYPNVALQPERSDNFNLGLYGTIRMAPGHVLYYEGSGFLRLVDDYIQATVSQQEGMMQYENVDAVHIKGVEGEVRYDWSDKLHLMVNASYQDARDQRRYKQDGKPSVTYHNRTPNKPWSFLNAEASYTFKHLWLPSDRLRLSYEYQWVHWFYLTWEAYGSSKTKARVPTQNLSNVGLLYSWKDGRYNFSLQCTNLFDKIAYDNYMLQKPGRAFFAKFRLFIQ